MTFSDLSEFCRLCLMPLNGSYIDCALSDHAELKDTIKMVYNVDVSQNILLFQFLLNCILFHSLNCVIAIVIVVVLVK